MRASDLVGLQIDQIDRLDTVHIIGKVRHASVAPRAVLQCRRTSDDAAALKPGLFRAADKLMAMLGKAGRKPDYAE